MVAQYHAQLLARGLDMQGADLLLEWAAPEMRTTRPCFTLPFSRRLLPSFWLSMTECGVLPTRHQMSNTFRTHAKHGLLKSTPSF